MLSLSQVIVPLAVVGNIDDSTFTTPADYLQLFATQIVASRALGTLVRGRCFVALNVAQRAFSSLPEIGEWNSPVLLTSSSDYPEAGKIDLFADITLADDTARLE